MITEGVWNILVSSQVDQSPLRTELINLAQENTEIFSIIQSKSPKKPNFRVPYKNSQGLTDILEKDSMSKNWQLQI